MAVDFKTEHKKTNAYTFLPEHIVVKSELNGRQDKPDIEWLINDILRHGQHTPVMIRRDGGAAVLVAGFSRWRAVSEINKRKLLGKGVKMPLRCHYVQATEKEGLLLNISENRFRNATTPIDDAHNIKNLLNIHAMTEEEIAGVYFPTAKTPKELKEAVKFVRSRIELIALSPASVEAVKSGRVSETAASAIAKLSEAQQKEVLKKEGAIERKDVVPAKTKPAPKPGKPDSELVRRVTLMLEDVDGVLNNADAYVEIETALVVSVRDYMKELSAR